MSVLAGDGQPDELLPILWHEQSSDFRHWLAARATSTLQRLPGGYEGDTWVLVREGVHQYVLKRWNKGFTADAKGQHAFLARARRVGLPVPRPVGWGVDAEGHQILATRFAGSSLAQPTD